MFRPTLTVKELIYVRNKLNWGRRVDPFSRYLIGDHPDDISDDILFIVENGYGDDDSGRGSLRLPLEYIRDINFNWNGPGAKK